MKFWNTETRREDGVYYRNMETWSIERPDDWDNKKDNFTKLVPPHPYVNWDGEKWIEDTEEKESVDALELLEDSDQNNKMIRALEDTVKFLLDQMGLTINDLPDTDEYKDAKQRLQARINARTKIKK